MYQKKLKIMIFSGNPELMETLQKVGPQEDFEHEFLPPALRFSRSACEPADIVILDIAVKELPGDIRSCCKPHAALVFCDRSDGQDTMLAGAGLEKVADAIWTMPLSAVRLAFYFQQLLNIIKLKQDLWMQEHIMDTMIDSMPDLVWIKDTKGAHLKVNQSFCNLVGKTKEQCQGRGHYYIWDIPPEEYSKGEFVCLESEEEVMQTRQTCRFEEKIKGPDNRMMQFTTYKSPVFDEDGELVGTLGIARNVTDWHNSNTKVNLILGAMSVPAMVLDEKTNILSVNKAWEKVFSSDCLDPVGRPYAIWKTDTLHTVPRLKPDMKEDISYKTEAGALDLVVREEPILDMFGQLIGYYCVFADVTEHKKHIELLSKYQKQLEAAVRLKTRTLRDIQQKAYVSFAEIINSRDPATGDHLRNTTALAEVLLAELKREKRHPELEDEEYCDAVLRSVPLHDIGKIGLPDDVLRKKGRYTAEEYQAMTRHTVEGKKIIDKTIGQIETFKFYKVAQDMVHSHHERWDGQGYPRGLRGNEIPFSARIMSVVDVFDALISPRPYNATRSIDQAYVVIKAVAGAQLDPEVAAAFIIARPVVEKLVHEKFYHL